MAVFFLGPGLGGLLRLHVGPILASLVLTFYEWDLLTSPRFVGLDNFRRLWTDDDFWAALRHTLTFIAGYVPLVMVLALLVALALNARLRGLSVLRTAFFLPVVSSWVAVALLWSWLFNPRFGLVNYCLSRLGVDGPGWLFDPDWAMPAIILTSVWKDLGFVMVLFLAGLQAIPARLLRGRLARRRRRVRALPLDHPAAAGPDDLLRHRHLDHQLLPGLRPGLGDDRGRPGRRDHRPGRARRQPRLHLRRDGLRRRDLLGPLRPRLPRHAGPTLAAARGAFDDG